MGVGSRSTSTELSNEIKQLLNASLEVRYLFRLCCVSLVLSGCRPQQVGDCLGINGRSVSRWLARYREHGLPGLRDGLANGRPGQLDPTAKAALVADLRRPPIAVGLDGQLWTGPLLRDWLARSYGVHLSLRQCQRILRLLQPP